MVLKVLSDREIDDWVDADRAQMIGRPDAGQHQHLWRVERATAKTEPRRWRGLFPSLSTLDKLDSGGLLMIF